MKCFAPFHKWCVSHSFSTANGLVSDLTLDVSAPHSLALSISLAGLFVLITIHRLYWFSGYIATGSQLYWLAEYCARLATVPLLTIAVIVNAQRMFVSWIGLSRILHSLSITTVSSLRFGSLHFASEDFASLWKSSLRFGSLRFVLFSLTPRSFFIMLHYASKGSRILRWGQCRDLLLYWE